MAEFFSLGALAYSLYSYIVSRQSKEITKAEVISALDLSHNGNNWDSFMKNAVIFGTYCESDRTIIPYISKEDIHHINSTNKSIDKTNKQMLDKHNKDLLERKNTRTMLNKYSKEVKNNTDELNKIIQDFIKQKQKKHITDGYINSIRSIETTSSKLNKTCKDIIDVDTPLRDPTLKKHAFTKLQPIGILNTHHDNYRLGTILHKTMPSTIHCTLDKLNNKYSANVYSTSQIHMSPYQFKQIHELKSKLYKKKSLYSAIASTVILAGGLALTYKYDMKQGIYVYNYETDDYEKQNYKNYSFKKWLCNRYNF